MGGPQRCLHFVGRSVSAFLRPAFDRVSKDGEQHIAPLPAIRHEFVSETPSLREYVILAVDVSLENVVEIYPYSSRSRV